MLHANSLPPGAVKDFKFENIGVCHKLTLECKDEGKNTRNDVIYSAENCTSTTKKTSRQLHPNKRVAAATVTSGGIANVVRVLQNSGLHTPAESEIKKQRQNMFKVLKGLGEASMERKRQAISRRAIAAGHFIKHNGKKVAAVVAHSDGCGSKRSYNAYFTGEGVFVGVMCDGGVIGAVFKQNNGKEEYRNLCGSVSVGEVLAVREIARYLLIEANTNMHLRRLAADDDTRVIKGLKEEQRLLKVPVKHLATTIAVICHNIKNFDKALLKAKAKHKIPSLWSGRVKAIGKDMRDNIARCGEQLRPILDDQKTNDKKMRAITRRYIEEHLPRVIDHHCGNCANCDPKFCRLKILIDANEKKPESAKKTLPELQTEYLTQETMDNEGRLQRSRFNNFLVLDDHNRNVVMQVIRARYTHQALVALAPMLDNNDVERLWSRLIVLTCGKRLNITQAGFGEAILMATVCATNDGYSWYNDFEEKLGLKTMDSARQARIRLTKVREKDRLRKQQPDYQQTRRERTARVDQRTKRESSRNRYKSECHKAGDNYDDSKPKKRARKQCPRCGEKDHTAAGECFLVEKLKRSTARKVKPRVVQDHELLFSTGP